MMQETALHKLQNGCMVLRQHREKLSMTGAGRDLVKVLGVPAKTGRAVQYQCCFARKTLITRQTKPNKANPETAKQAAARPVASARLTYSCW